MTPQQRLHELGRVADPRNGEVVEDVVSLIDVLPTLTEALDLPLATADREAFTGIDVLAAGGVARDYALAQRSPGKHRTWGLEPKFAWVGRDWKLVHVPDRPVELFDLRHELNDGSSRLLVVEEESPEVLEQLRSLGYIQ